MRLFHILFALLIFSAAAMAAPDASVGPSMDHALRLLASDEVVWAGVSGPGGSLPGPGAHAALPVLLETVQAEDEQERVRALEALAKLDAQGQAEVFFNALADPSVRVRECAARVVSQFDSGVVFDRVMDELAGPASGRFDEAMMLLRTSLEPRMLEVLQSADASAERRAAAAYSLGKMGSVAAVPALSALAWGNDEWLASVAVQALLGVADPAVIARLADLTAHPSEQIRWNALEGLGALGGYEGIQALGRVAITRPADDKELSRRAVQLLGATQDPVVIPILIEAMDRNLAVRRLSVEALSQLTGKDFGDLPSVWIEWWQKVNDPSVVQQQMPQQKLPFDVDYLE